MSKHTSGVAMGEMLSAIRQADEAIKAAKGEQEKTDGKD